MKCLHPVHGKQYVKAASRGLCKRHYGQAQYLVHKLHRTTWRQLETQHKVLPPRDKANGLSPEAAWFVQKGKQWASVE